VDVDDITPEPRRGPPLDRGSTLHERRLLASKKVLTREEVDEMSDQSENIEHKTFVKDGFEAAVDQAA
jgi:hypothetical protein